MRIAVMSTFDIDPANDGGRLRYRAMLGELSKRHDVTVVAYHLGYFPGMRSYKLAPRLQVHVAPCLPGDAGHCWHEYSRTQAIAHDVMCIRTYQLSDDFLRLCAEHVGAADVVIVAHPYLLMPAMRYRRRDAVQVYESYNVEYDAKVKHFAGTDRPTRASHLADVAAVERIACQSSHYVTAVSAADATRLEGLYDLAAGSVQVAANGVDTGAYPRFGAAEKQAFRARLGIPDCADVAVFVGSGYGPNVESYRAARAMLHAAGFTGCVVLVGSIAQAARSGWPAVPFREIWLGFVSDALRICAVGCADFALQIMTTGAGTNLKLFDYMASYTPIIANAFGARGVDGGDWCLRCDTAAELRQVLVRREWRSANGVPLACARTARNLAEERFDWRMVASNFERNFMGNKKDENIRATIHSIEAGR